MAQVSFSIDLTTLWYLIPNTIIIAVFYFAFVSKINDIVGANLTINNDKQDTKITKMVKDCLDAVEKLEMQYEQRLVMMDAKLHSTEQNVNNITAVTRTLETHNMHVLKSMDEIKESMIRLHERLDSRDNTENRNNR